MVDTRLQVPSWSKPEKTAEKKPPHHHHQRAAETPRIAKEPRAQKTRKCRHLYKHAQFLLLGNIIWLNLHFYSQEFFPWVLWLFAGLQRSCSSLFRPQYISILNPTCWCHFLHLHGFLVSGPPLESGCFLRRCCNIEDVLLWYATPVLQLMHVTVFSFLFSRKCSHTFDIFCLFLSPFSSVSSLFLLASAIFPLPQSNTCTSASSSSSFLPRPSLA